jgi:hypothetical protein
MGTNQAFPGVVQRVSGLISEDRPPPPETTRATDELFKQVKNARIWIEQPQMLNRSRTLLTTSFRELNPWQPHRELEPTFPILSAYQLAKEGSLYAGRQVTLVGQVRYVTVAGTTGTRTRLGRTLIYLAQIGAGPKDDPLVYCLFSDAAHLRVRPGMQIVAVGVPIAQGSIRLARGGFAEGAYMAGAMVGPYFDPREVVAAAERQRRQA